MGGSARQSPETKAVEKGPQKGKGEQSFLDIIQEAMMAWTAVTLQRPIHVNSSSGSDAEAYKSDEEEADEEEGEHSMEEADVMHRDEVCLSSM